MIKAFRLSSSELTPLSTNASTLDVFTASIPAGFYSTFSTLHGATRVLGLQAHLHRLYQPALQNQLTPAINEAGLRQHIADLAKQNLPNESRIRIILIKETGEVYLALQSFEPLPAEVYQNGVHVISSVISRNDPRIKDTSFITQSTAQRKLLNQSVFEILLTKNEKVLEGMTSNFYVIRKDGILITSSKGILLGVTRKAVLQVAQQHGFQIKYRAPSLHEDFDEALLTSSSRGVVPIVSIDSKPVGQGKVGEFTKKLIAGYQNYVLQNSETIV